MAQVQPRDLVGSHPTAPALNSRTGATYTLCLNFAGFDYTGDWGGGIPGNVPAYSADNIRGTSTWAATS